MEHAGDVVERGEAAQRDSGADHAGRGEAERSARGDAAVASIGAAGLFGLSLPQLLQLEARAKQAPAANGATPNRSARATSVIMVWLAGGPATIDMWDVKPNAPEGIRGEFSEINTNVTGVRISRHLPRMAQVADKCTIVRSLHHSIPAHGPATVFMTTGNRPTPALQYPAIGSLVTRLLPSAQGVPPYVSFNELRNGGAGQAGYLGTAYNPFIVEGEGGLGGQARGQAAANLRVRGITLPTGFSLEDLENRNRLLQGFDRGFAAVDRNADLVDGLDAFHRQALDILRSDRTRNAFNLNQESTTLRQRLRHDSLWPRRAGGAAVGSSGRAVRDAEPGRLGYPQPELQRAAHAQPADVGSDLVGPDSGFERSGHAQQHHRLLRRRIWPHAADQPQQWPRSLGAVDGGRAGRWWLQARLCPRHHGRSGHGCGH